VIWSKKSFTAVAALAATALVAGCGGGSWDSNAAPTRNDALALYLITQFPTNISGKNTAELKTTLAPNFQLQRGTGPGIDRNQFLGKLPDLRSVKILPPVIGLEYGNTLTVTYHGVSNLVVDGQAFKTAPTPLITVFQKDADGHWHILGHGNFNKPK
jgi:hypothetical protein